MMKRIAILIAALLISVGLGVAAGPTPALANGPCSSGQLCLFPCYLAESCNAWFRSAVSPGCYPTGATGLEHLTYSVKNLTPKTMTVYHTTNCSSSGGTSVLYANHSGNLAYPWIGAGIKSFRVP